MENVLRFGGGRGGQQQQAVGLLAEVRADGIKPALKDPLTKSFFQVGLDTASEALIVGDQGNTIAAHELSPYRVGVGEWAAPRRGHCC
jgi:hypothetical protein